MVGLARTIARNTEKIEGFLGQAACDQGDFAEYARLRAEISALEADAARNRRADRRAESLNVLLELKPGDILRVPAGRHQGWAVVVGHGQAKGDPHPPGF